MSLSDTQSAANSQEETWSERYGDRHRWNRFVCFPPGITPPKKVRLYQRAGHYLLNWWDPAAKRNLSERVDGDLLTALARARQIDDRVTTVRTAGVGSARRIIVPDLVAKFLTDLTRRSDAGEISSHTVSRYRSALEHLLAYCANPGVEKQFPTAAQVNREFRLGLLAFLSNRHVSGNGRANATHHPMRGQEYVLDTVRAMFEWAADPNRGALLPAGFVSPFLRNSQPRAVLKGDPLAAPDITLPMALELVNACDAFQLRLLVPVLLFGLRAAEPCILFVENMTDDWLKVPCIPELGILTKARRDKRFPLIEDLRPFWGLLRADRPQGLLHERHAVHEGREKAPLRTASLAELIAEYQQRCAQAKNTTALDRDRIRERLLKDAGGIDYDGIQDEFAALAKQLGWPVAATLKDLRHLFATTMNNAAMPEAYRKYLLGQAPGRAAITAYTHLNDLPRHYAEAVRREWAPLVAAVNSRVAEVAAAS
jgi:hypothetical protein